MRRFKIGWPNAPSARASRWSLTLQEDLEAGSIPAAHRQGAAWAIAQARYCAARAISSSSSFMAPVMIVSSGLAAQ
jgi:hypothetical protein